MAQRRLSGWVVAPRHLAVGSRRSREPTALRGDTTARGDTCPTHPVNSAVTSSPHKKVSPHPAISLRSPRVPPRAASPGRAPSRSGGLACKYDLLDASERALPTGANVHPLVCARVAKPVHARVPGVATPLPWVTGVIAEGGVADSGRAAPLPCKKRLWLRAAGDFFAK